MSLRIDTPIDVANHPHKPHFLRPVGCAAAQEQTDNTGLYICIAEKLSKLHRESFRTIRLIRNASVCCMGSVSIGGLVFAMILPDNPHENEMLFVLETRALRTDPTVELIKISTRERIVSTPIEFDPLDTHKPLEVTPSSPRDIPSLSLHPTSSPLPLLRQ